MVWKWKTFYYVLFRNLMFLRNWKTILGETKCLSVVSIFIPLVSSYIRGISTLCLNASFKNESDSFMHVRIEAWKLKKEVFFLYWMMEKEDYWVLVELKKGLLWWEKIQNDVDEKNSSWRTACYLKFIKCSKCNKNEPKNLKLKFQGGFMKQGNQLLIISFKNSGDN